jgi:hypothetical protein
LYTTTYNIRQTGRKKKTRKHTQKQNGHHTKSISEYGTTIEAKRETNWKLGPSGEKAIIVGIPSTATYRIRREVGNKKVKTVNMQKLKPRHCGDGDGPPEEDEGEQGRDTKGRRIKEESETKDKDVSKEEENKTKTQKHKPKTKRKKRKKTKKNKTLNRNTRRKGDYRIRGQRR